MSWARRAKRLAAAAYAKVIRIVRRVEDRTVLLFNGLFTTGRQMPAVARLLLVPDKAPAPCRAQPRTVEVCASSAWSQSTSQPGNRSRISSAAIR
ncbi:hypothetical protein ACWCQR_02230, partial [Streptomyces sp. NPDC002172]